MEHECDKCDAAWTDNAPGGSCPKCGSLDVTSYCDEEPNSHPTDFTDFTKDEGEDEDEDEFWR